MKQVFILLLIAACSMTAFSQPKTTLSTSLLTTPYCDDALVKVCNSTTAVVYGEVGGTGVVYKKPLSLSLTTTTTYTTKYCYLPTGIEILDMYVVDSMLFMCGRNNAISPRRGVLVAIDLQSMSGQYIEIQKSFRLNHIVAYNSSTPSIYSVVASGKYYTVLPSGDTVACEKVFYSQYLPSSPTGWGYDERELEASMSDYETIDDIVLTNKNIVLVSRHEMNRDVLMLRKCDLSTPLGTMMDTRYRYALSSIELANIFNAIAIQNEMITTSSYTEDGGSGICFRTIDLNTMSMITVQKVLTQEKIEVPRLAHVPADNSIVALLRQPSGIAEMYYINPLSGYPYVADYVFDPTYKYIDVDACQPSSVVAVGYGAACFFDKLISVSTSCLLQNSNIVYALPPVAYSIDVNSKSFLLGGGSLNALSPASSATVHSFCY